MTDKLVRHPHKMTEVRVPWQGFDVEVEPRPIKEVGEMYEDETFTPFGVVTNFDIVNKKTGKSLEKLDTPFELRVRYEESDFKKAAEKGMLLRLAYWKGGRWNLFTAKKHRFHLISEGPFVGVGVAKITDWGDPMVSWGT